MTDKESKYFFKKTSLQKYFNGQEVLSTEVTKDDIKNGWEDERGVIYSKDKKRLLKAPYNIKDYKILEGTKVIGNNAFSESCEEAYLTSIVIPSSVTSIFFASLNGKVAFGS